MKIKITTKKCEETTQVLDIIKFYNKKVLTITHFRQKEISCIKLEFSDINEMNKLYNRIISEDIVDITHYYKQR